MIFGNGLIAKELKKFKFFDDFNIIAMGISNSKEENEYQYKRQEIEILRCINTIKKYYPGKQTIYISSIISNNELLYFKKKVEIEEILKAEIKDLKIVRLTNVVGLNQNPNNIFKYFFDQIGLDNMIKVNSNAIRNIIDVNDVALILIDQLSLGCNNDIKIGYKENISALILAEIIQRHYGKTNLVKSFLGEFNYVGLNNHEIKFLDNYFEGFISVDSYISTLIDKYFIKTKV